jgi:hypothetical protein
MPWYRIYVLNHSGRVEHPPAVVQHEDDATAIDHAKQVLDGHDIELWAGPRLVIRLASKDKG